MTIDVHIGRGTAQLKSVGGVVFGGEVLPCDPLGWLIFGRSSAGALCCTIMMRAVRNRGILRTVLQLFLLRFAAA
jgi:hypothetical protein